MPTSEDVVVAKRRRNEEIKARFFSAPLAANRYRVTNLIGEGAYGIVCSAIDMSTSQKVAVKRILRCLDTHPMATRILRELKFLRLLSKHENIIQVKDVLLPGKLDKFNDTFVVFELMPTDLNRFLRSKTGSLRPEHIKYFMFQLLCGINFMHAARVFHRDLKPNNILINSKCNLRICDFGLARAAFQTGPETRFWTDYVATRWYRAPELIMEYQTNYSTAIDMWSVGCIFAELLGGGKVLFPGKNSKHQYELITDVIGAPPPQAVERLRNPNSRRVLMQFQNSNKPRRPLEHLFPDADPLAIEVLRSMLAFDAQERISALDALNHAYFSEYRHLGLGAEAEPLPAWEFEFERKTLTPHQMREEFLREILQYHPEASAEVLRSWSTGREFRFTSAVDRFGMQMNDLQQQHGPTNLQSMTLEEQVLGHITEDRGVSGGYATHRHHATMSESELGQYNRR